MRRGPLPIRVVSTVGSILLAACAGASSDSVATEPLASGPRTATSTTTSTMSPTQPSDDEPDGTDPLTVSSRVSGIDRAIGEREEAGTFAGVVLAGDGDDVLHAAAYGSVDPSGDLDHDLSRAWPWASLTKLVTAVLILGEVDEGRLALDDSIGTLVEVPDDVAGVTVRELLTHTAGLADPEATPLNEAEMPTWYEQPSPDLEYCVSQPARPTPSEVSYNNCDFAVLGRVLETVTGRTYVELIEAQADEWALDGLVVADAGVETMPGFDGAERIDRGNRLASYGAAGALIGPPDAALRFARSLATGDLVSDDSLQLIGDGDPELGFVSLGAWGYEGRFPGCGSPVRLIERRGDIEGIHALLLLAPESGRSVVAFSNRSATDWGQIWAGEGLAFELATAVFCDDAAA